MALSIFLQQLLWALFPTVLCASDYLSIQFPDGPLPEAQVEVRQSGDLLYVDLGGFAEALNIPTFINAEKRKIQYSVGSIRLKWTADNVFVVIGSEIYQLPAEVLYQEKKFWAPLDPFLEILSRVYPAVIDYQRYNWTITVKPTSSDVYAIQYEPKENGTLIRIACTRKFDISKPALRDRYLSITLLGASINRSALESTPPAGVVQKILIEELPESVQLTFKLSAPVLEHSLWQEDNPHQILISLITRIISSTPNTAVPVLENEDVSQLLEREQDKWKIDCVVIDPGHGGKDPGAIGRGGLREKEVVLDIALRLKKLLEKNTKLKVVLTRQDDRFIALHDRTALANQVGGKLFISIHCNSNRARSAGGFETYFLKPARSQRAMEVALLENSVIKYEESKDQYQDLTEENFILLAMAQSEFVRESETLAAIVQNKLHLNIGLKNRGVDQAGFYVLVGASMPAILVETAFLSNKREERLLRTKKFRQQVAQSIYESILEFKRQEESVQQGKSTTRF